MINSVPQFLKALGIVCACMRAPLQPVKQSSWSKNYYHLDYWIKSDMIEGPAVGRFKSHPRWLIHAAVLHVSL